MSLHFFGRSNALDCLDFVRGLHSFRFDYDLKMQEMAS